MKKYKNIIFLVLVIIACFVLDLVTKNIALDKLVEYESKPVINGFFYFTLCYNTGGAWSMFSGNVAILAAISVVALALVIFTMVKSNTMFYKYSSAIFIGGLIGNLYDRLVYHKVVDFLDFVIFGYDFPVFNIADCFICVGVALMLIAMIREEKKNGRVSA